MNFNERLQALRKSKGMSQEELAERVGVSRQAVSKWETGETTPEVSKIIALAELFGVTTDALLIGDEKKTDPSAGAAKPDGGTYRYREVSSNDMGGVFDKIVKWFKRKSYVGGIFVSFNGLLVAVIGGIFRAFLKNMSSFEADSPFGPDDSTMGVISLFFGISTALIIIGAIAAAAGIIIAVVLKIKMRND